MLPKTSGSMIGAEIANYATEVLSKQCTETLKNSLEKPAHKQDALNFKKNGDIIMEKE